ncbi:hypothetical protein JCM11491_006491, partial [Sporobolomyces phaffii]
SHQSPSYKLYALILHSGSGPHSGHYTALVRAGNGKFYDMNDDLVSPVNGVPLTQKNAYCLFYVREKGDQLKEIINGGGGEGTGVGKKRKRDSINGRDGSSGEVVKRASASASASDASSSPVGKKVKPSTYSPGKGPSPPQVLTASNAKSAPSSPKLSTTFNPFEASPAVQPSSSTEGGGGGGQGLSAAAASMSDLHRSAIESRLKKKGVKEFKSRHSQSSSSSQGSQQAGEGKKSKLANRMLGRSKPKNAPRMLK